jgi:hypothetical protein
LSSRVGRSEAQIVYTAGWLAEKQFYLSGRKFRLPSVGIITLARLLLNPIWHFVSIL